MLTVILANLKWDPTVRGILFPGIMFLILCGSTYVILATNIGNRLGFLLANAAFWGWMALMCVVWMMYGIGLKGKDPSWKGIEAVSDPTSAQFEKVALLPAEPDKKIKGWRVVPEGSTTAGDSSAALGAFLKRPVADGGAALFPSTGAERYKSIATYETGGDQIIKIRPRKIKGEKWYDPTSYRWMGLLHSKHYIVEIIKPYKLDASNEPVKDAEGHFVVDTAAKPIYVVGYRDQGSKRQPPFIIFICSTILFAISALSLHRRDKQVMAHMANFKPARA